MEIITTIVVGDKMPKYILNVAENWYRRYIVEAESEDKVIETYHKYLSVYSTSDPAYRKVDQISDPEYLDDGPDDAFIIEGEYTE